MATRRLTVLLHPGLRDSVEVRAWVERGEHTFLWMTDPLNGVALETVDLILGDNAFYFTGALAYRIPEMVITAKRRAKARVARSTDPIIEED